MKIVCISDVHGKWHKLKIPSCDLLVSAGDFSFRGEETMVTDFHKWLSGQDAKHVISVMGNHETAVEKNFFYNKELALQNCPRAYFIDEGPAVIDGLKVYGSAITPFFCNWAWNRHRGSEIKKHWDKIPDDTELLITHGPAFGILDKVNNGYIESVGCEELLGRIGQLKNLKAHVFGHLHSNNGQVTVNGVTYINAAICDESYHPVQPIQIIEI